MENEEWGPWIAHDGVGRVKHIKVGDVVQFQSVAWDKPFENVRTMTQFDVDADCTSNPAVWLTRYRIRKPRALRQLREMVEGLPADQHEGVDA